MASKATAEATTPNVETRKAGTRHLACVLTEEERMQAGRDLARRLEDREDLEGGLASVKAEFKAKLEANSGEVKRLTKLVDTGIEYRMVPITEQLDFTGATVTVFREDTGEILQTREMRDDERQRSLPVDDEDAVEEDDAGDEEG